MNLIKDPHLSLESPSNTLITLANGSYVYYHYRCDGLNDVGWGCGYRTLQTICSWIKFQLESLENSISGISIPSIFDIQKALVTVGDKTESFLGSREWIGSIEVSYVIDYFYKIPCRLIHARNIDDLKGKSKDIVEHFADYGSPIMMGGDQDCSSKCIIGIGFQEDKIWLLILDPHFSGSKATTEKLIKDGWIKWILMDSLMQSSFYNMCCPLLKSKCLL